MPANRIAEIGELILSVLPVTGEILSARDAYQDFAAAIEAARQGDSGEALRESGAAALQIGTAHFSKIFETSFS